jgi:polyketide cyclase/dehydrase/lipid transport protein
MRLMTLMARIGRLFARNPTTEAVETTMHFDASPEAVWRGMLFYEEVPRRSMPLLSMFLPAPLRTEGDKTRIGAIIACTYDHGYLEKRITVAEPARLVRFDVLVQQLGIEDCISMDDGSYEIHPEAGGTQLVLTTRYRGHLRPRWLARPFEHYLAHRLHRHILHGMRAVVEAPGPRGGHPQTPGLALPITVEPFVPEIANQ